MDAECGNELSVKIGQALGRIMVLSGLVGMLCSLAESGSSGAAWEQEKSLIGG